MKSALAIDARMIAHSGIGVVLRALIAEWQRTPPPWDLLLCGNPAAIRREVPAFAGEIVAWNPKLYGFAAALGRPPLPRRTAAWYSPHYATTLRPGLPLVCHVQDVLHITHPTRAMQPIYNRAYLAALRRRASFVLTTSRHVKVQLQTLYGFRADRVLITGLGPGLVETDSRELPAPLAGRRYALAVGIWRAHKNWDWLLRRWAESGPTETLACAGLGVHAPNLLRRAAELGIADRVVALDRLEPAALRRLYEGSLGLVFPSLAEGFGLPVLEAMSLGVPVVCPNRSPMSEVCGGHAFLYDPDYTESFDRALAQMLGGDRSHVDAALRRSRDFSWAATAARVADAIERAITGA